MSDEKKSSFWKKILKKFLKKEEAKMLVSGLDKEVEEIVNILNENGMRPFASCDGTIKGHLADGEKNKHDVSLGYINMLDSDKVRDLFAILQEDDSYQLMITAQADGKLYGNEIKGLRYGIYFDNLKGGKVQELTQKLTDYLSGNIKPSKEQRARIDEASRLVNLNKDDNLIVQYYIHEIFKLHNMDEVKENYSVKFQQIEMKKDPRPLRIRSIQGEEQNLHIELDQISYRNGDFEQSLKVLAGLYDIYEMLPEIAPENVKNIIQEEYEKKQGFAQELQPSQMFVETQKFWQSIQRNTENCIEELNQMKIDKSIARHQRKLKKIEEARKRKRSEDIEV